MKCLLNVCYPIWYNALSYIAFCHMNIDTLVYLILYYIWMSLCCVAMFAHVLYCVYYEHWFYGCSLLTFSLSFIFQISCVLQEALGVPLKMGSQFNPSLDFKFLQFMVLVGWASDAATCANTPNLCMQGLVQHWLDPIGAQIDLTLNQVVRTHMQRHQII